MRKGTRSIPRGRRRAGVRERQFGCRHYHRVVGVATTPAALDPRLKGKAVGRTSSTRRRRPKEGMSKLELAEV